MITDVGLVSHLIACLGFGALAAWLALGRQWNAANVGLIIACAMTALWAAAVALSVPYPRFGAVVGPAETLRSAAWIGFLVSLLARSWRLAESMSSSFVIAIALGFVITAQLGIDVAVHFGASAETAAGRVLAYFGLMTRLTVAIGGLVLVHNLYVNAAPEQRWGIRFLCIGLGGLFGYDLNLYTLYLLFGLPSDDLLAVRGAVDALVVPLIALSAWRNRAWKLTVSRQVAFHTLSLGAIGGYLILMSVAAYGLRLVGGDWGRLLQIVFLCGALILAVVVLFSGRARAWTRVQISKNFFAYRYDYRQEWLRFIRTVSGGGASYDELSTRVVQAVCAIVDSPGGSLYAPDADGGFEQVARWNYRNGATGRLPSADPLVAFLGHRQRIVDFDELRDGTGDYDGMTAPAFALTDRQAWLAVPLIHLERLAGFIVVERSLAPRQLNWEDFDLLRTVGRQGASYIAEQSSQAALLEASKFDEFNRRFAFIMHDIKNLVSQLSLVARNAERHADNPEFRADMVKTLQSSVGKMNDLLARLAQHNTARPDDAAPTDLSEVVGAAVAAKREVHPLLLLVERDRGLMVEADAPRLEQVFIHLVQNAIDASAADAPVQVELRRDGDRARVDVTDQGSGMTSAFIRNDLFKPFKSTKAGGFGIGAYEAREIVRAAGGRLDVASRPGEGTIFTVMLPLIDAGVASERKRA